MRRRGVGSLVGLLSALALLAGEADVELRKWIDGPVRYIANKQEVQDFRALESDASRALFIEKFWARRDPSPESLSNEYRQRFWERVQQANDNFVDSTKPGWMTDRGKVHILYGPPTSKQSDHDLAPQTNATSGHGVERWVYEGRPGQRTDVDPVVVVPFVRSVDGEYRLDYDPKLSAVFWDPLAIEEQRHRTFDRFQELTSAPSQSRLSVMLDLGRMQEVPPQERVLIESVETLESYQTLPLRVKVDRFLDPEERTLAVVNVDLLGLVGEQRPAILARFTPLDPKRPTRLLGEDSFRLESHEGYHVAQARIALDPGEYALTLIVADPVRVQTGVHRGQVEVPPPPEELGFSDPVWAEEVAPLPYASLASHDEAFVVGPFRVLPKIDDVYRRGHSLRLFFEVYRAEAPFRVRYQLEGRDDDGRWVRLGQPSSSEQQASAVAWELPTTERWPLGEYRVKVEVVDAAERVATILVPFQLVGEGP